MAVGDVYEVCFEMNMAGRVVSTNTYYEETIVRTGTVAEVSFQLGVLSETGFWTTFWKPFAAAALTFRRSRCQKIYPTRDAPWISLALANDPGTALGGYINPQVAVLISQQGLTWSREFRGRAFLPGFGETETEQGRIDSIPWASLTVAAGVFYNGDESPGAPAGGTFTQGLISPKRLKASTPPVFSAYGQIGVVPRISRQVKRQTRLTTVA